MSTEYQLPIGYAPTVYKSGIFYYLTDCAPKPRPSGHRYGSKYSVSNGFCNKKMPAQTLDTDANERDRYVVDLTSRR